jgi:cytochrome c oxidase cbb3-type subunit 2
MSTPSQGPAPSGHARIETNNFLMIVLILVVIAVGGIVEIVPLFFQRSLTQPVEGLKPYTALQQAGRDIYTREGCYNCHSQMIRPLLSETLRYGPYSMAGEFVYDHPFQWGSKRTGPDLHRVGGNPWLANTPVDGKSLPQHLKALRTVGVPYTDEDIAQAGESVKGKTELDALIAYLQVLGTSVK